jgi:ATP-dependent RNA helicase DeaD
VATPGRLVDHLQRRVLSLQNVGLLVLDEADRMLDMGFAPQLNEILRHLPANRQTLLFSATLPDNIMGLANRYLKNPVRVNAGSPETPVQKIHHSVVQTTPEAKNDVLLDELNAREGSVLIFTRTKHRTDRVAKFLSKFGYAVTRLHGDRTQSQRDAAIKGFRGGTYRILVATDIAARGLDIPHIAHVINYDLPQSPEDYVHRIGRTARAGAEGEAICLLVPEDQGQWRRIARLYMKDEGHTHAKKAPVIEHRKKSAVSLDDSLPEQRPRIIPRVQR